MFTLDKLSNPKFIMLLFGFLVFSCSSIFAQSNEKQWKLNINFAAMKPFFKNDQWFVTSEAYHLHPRSEDFIPGLRLGIERSLVERISIEFSFLYGLPPATLGVIDQFSASGREFLDTLRM